MNLLKKTKLILTLSVIIIITALFFLYKQSFVHHSGLPRIDTPLPTITTSISIPNQFIWQIDNLKLPTEIKIVSTEPNTQGETILKNLAQNLGFQNQPSTIPNTPLIIYSNLLKATEIYLNTQDNLIKFTFNLLQRPIPKTTAQNQGIETIKQALSLSENISITKTSTRYQTIVGPRFVNTTKDKATLITNTYNYSLNSLPILFPNGNSIETIHSLSGKLVKLTLNLPPVIPAQAGFQVPSGETYTNPVLPVKTIDQIKNTPRSQFTTIALSGDQKFQLSDQEINIDTAHLNNGFLGYIHHQNTLIPHIFLTGTTQDPNYGQIELLLATPAIE